MTLHLNHYTFWIIVSFLFLLLFIFLYRIKKLSSINNALTEASKAQASFLANISHEIRTPMNSILGMIYLIKETPLTKTQDSYINKMENSSNNLLNLINDILDISKIEAQKLRLEKRGFDILNIIHSINYIMSIERYEKNLEFNIIYDKSSSTKYYGDSIKITQILTNLISNAIKFTEKGKIELIIENINYNRIRFIVSDTGIGLSKEEQKNIFSSFTQADSSITRKYGGTGLGLAISKELISLMNGKIWVKSVVGEGSVFTFEIELETRKNNVVKNNPLRHKKVIHQLHKPKLDKETTNKLFRQLKQAVQKRRPQLCTPLLEELKKYTFDEKDTSLFENVTILISKYKFDKAKELLNEY